MKVGRILVSLCWIALVTSEITSTKGISTSTLKTSTSKTVKNTSTSQTTKKTSTKAKVTTKVGIKTTSQISTKVASTSSATTSGTSSSSSQTSSSSTSSTPKTTSRLNYPCGTLLDLKSNDPRNPSTPGLFSGTFFDGSPLYPGVGNFSECNAIIFNANILSSSKFPSGAYSTCGQDDTRKLFVDTSTAKYYYAHEDLNWIATNSTDAENVPGIIRILVNETFADTKFSTPIYTARFRLRCGGRMCESIGIFRVDSDSKQSIYWMGQVAMSTLRYLNFDILACTKVTTTTVTSTTSTTTTKKKITSTSTKKATTRGGPTTKGKPTFSLEKITTRPTTKSTTTTTTLSTTTTIAYSEKCGEFLRFDPASSDPRKNRPDIYGFSGGVDFGGLNQYIAYGDNRECAEKPSANPCPGYFLANQEKPGVMMSCESSKMAFDDKNASFLLNHQNLKWLSANITSMLDEDALQVEDSNFKFMFGRIMYRKAYRVGKIRLNEFSLFYKRGFYFTDENYKTKRFTSGFEVLTCSKCNNGGAGRYCCLNGANNPDCCLNGGTGPNCEPPCGTFIPYDPINDFKAPEVNGFAAGVSFKDNVTKQYVGYGATSVRQDPAPCIIDTAKASRGCYTEWSTSTEINDNKTAFYLLSHPNLTWIKTDIVNMMKFPDTLEIGGGTYNFLIGRVLYNGNYRIGRVHAGNGVFGFWIITPKGEVNINTGFEVLSCSLVDVNRLPCGTFLSYDTVKDSKAPELYGFVSGISFKDDSTKRYVGYGASREACIYQVPVPCNIDTKINDPGCYIPCGQEMFDNTQAFYLVKHPNLTWIATDIKMMMEIPDILKLDGYYDYPFFFGRTIARNFYRFGKVHAGNGQFGLVGIYLNGIKQPNEYISKSDFEVLSCSPKFYQPCGKFLPYNPASNIEAPELFGFAGGISYKDNSTKQFVGYGGSCGTYRTVPGSIETTPSKAGCYIPCDVEVFDNKTALYLLSHPKLKWIRTDVDAMLTIPETVNTPSGTFMFGRAFYKGNYRLGKVNPKLKEFRMLIDGKEMVLKNGFEVLSCAIHAEGTTNLFVPYDSQNDLTGPERFGLQIGTTPDNKIKLFVGYSGFSDFKAPCSIETTKGRAQCYTLFSPTPLKTSYYLLADPKKFTWIRNDMHHFKNTPSIVLLTNDKKYMMGEHISFCRIYVSGIYMPGMSMYTEDEVLACALTFDVDTKGNRKFEVLTNLPVTNAPCGTFTVYDPTNDFTPDVDGVEGGISFTDNKSKQFVAFGGSCGDQSPMAGYIETNSTRPGFFFLCGQEKLESKIAFYLLHTSNLSWTPTDVTRMKTIPDPVTFASGTKKIMFGRFWYEGHYRIGYISTTDQEPFLQVQIKNGTLKVKDDFEVLSCSGNVEQPCGTFVKYNPEIDITEPEREGFEGGVHFIDNKTIQYVGYGKSCSPEYVNMPCYIDTTPVNPGCFLACDKEILEKSSFYLKFHQKLTWVKTDVESMLEEKGALKITGGGLPLMFGRVKFKAGFYRFGVIHAMNGFYVFEYFGPKGLKTFTKTFEILTCS